MWCLMMYVTFDDHVEVGSIFTILSPFQFSHGKRWSPQDTSGASLISVLLPRWTLVQPCLPGPSRAVVWAFPCDAECLSTVVSSACEDLPAAAPVPESLQSKHSAGIVILSSKEGTHWPAHCASVWARVEWHAGHLLLPVFVVRSPSCGAHPHAGSLLFWESLLLIDP